MDRLFQRYADPFLFMDEMIRYGGLLEFVNNFDKTIAEEKEEQINWEFYLHKVLEGSFNDFVSEMEQDRKNSNLSKRTIETTIQHTNKILNTFNPEEKGGE